MVLGQCCIDLLPLLQGEQMFNAVEVIHMASHHNAAANLTSSLGEVPAQPLAELELQVSTPKPILSEEKLESSNLLTFCLESCFSLPEAWSTNGSSYIYSACMPMTTESDERDTHLLIPKGVFRPAGKPLVGILPSLRCCFLNYVSPDF